MLYRSLAIFITVFWLVMIGLLLRKEVGPGNSALREVPVASIVKLILTHEQPSDLHIYSDKLRLGRLVIHPHMRKEVRSRVIDFSGNLQLFLPGMDRQRVDWKGEIELEKTLAVRGFTMELKFRDPIQRDNALYRTLLTVSPPDNSLTWSLWRGDTQIEPPRTYTLDEPGFRQALQDMQIDLSLLQMVQGQTRSMQPPTIKALQSTMLIHGERIDTYLVSIQQSGQTLLEFDVDQLGHVLRAKTLIGYSLAPDDLVP